MLSSDLTKVVYLRLPDPEFRKRLLISAEDGTQPILVALPNDKISSVLNNVLKVGGAANVVVPYLDDVCVLAVNVT